MVSIFHGEGKGKEMKLLALFCVALGIHCTYWSAVNAQQLPYQELLHNPTSPFLGYGRSQNQRDLINLQKQQQFAVCDQSMFQQMVSGNIIQFLAGITGDLGSYTHCEEMLHSSWCGLYLVLDCHIIGTNDSFLSERTWAKCNTAPLYGITPALGMCVNPPSLCPTSQLQEELKNISRGDLGIPMQQRYGVTGNCTDDWVRYYCDAKKSYTYLEARCPRDRESWTKDKNAVTMVCVVSILIGICVLSTIICALDSSQEDFQAAWKNAGPEASPEEAPVVARGENSVQNLGNYGAIAESSKDSKDSDQKVKRWIPAGLLLCCKWFSLYESWQDLLKITRRGKGDIDTGYFEGLRCISMLFVIYGHTLFFPAVMSGFRNMESVLSFIKSYGSVGLFPALLSVDVFFYLSGFLFMHLYLKALEKQKAQQQRESRLDQQLLSTAGETPDASEASPVTGGQDPEETEKCWGVGVFSPTVMKHATSFRKVLMMVLKMYLRRYLRMTPLVMMTLAMAVWLFQYFAGGPLYALYAQGFYIIDCPTQWWHQLLYITNLKNSWESCMGWFWYLSCDMQLFILGPWIGMLYKWKPLVFYIVVCGAILGGIIGGTQQTVFIHQEEYVKAWYRMSPYFYGFLAATFVRSPILRQRMECWKWRALCYFISAALLVTCINLMWKMEVDLQNGELNQTFEYFVHAFCFTAWGLGWLVLAFPWSTGHCGILGNFLSHPIFIVLSKLTFGCYMIHPVILGLVTASRLALPDFTLNLFYMLFAGVVVWSFIAAAALYMVIEYPFAQLNNYFTK